MTEIIDTKQQIEENKWKVKKDKREKFYNLKILLTKSSKEFIDPAFHSSIRGLATKGFLTTPPVVILSHLQCLHVKTIYQDLNAARLRLK